MKSKIVVLCGESCSGKDTILDLLVEGYDFHRVISYTTRPKREGEVDGETYIYINNKEFDKLHKEGKLFEKTEYQTNKGLWQYGVGENSLSDTKDNVVIVNPHGLAQLLKNESIKDRLQVFYITASFSERFFRYINRENLSEKDKIELVDRLIRDEEDFKNFEERFQAKKLENNTQGDIDSIICHISQSSMSEVSLRNRLMDNFSIEDFQNYFKSKICWNDIDIKHKQFHCECDGEFNHKECSRCYTNNLQEISGTNIIVE